MPRTKVSMSQKVREYKNAHPEAGATEIAGALKCQKQLVYNALAYGKNKQKKGKGKAAKLDGHFTGNGHLISAVEFVRVVGGMERARAVLLTLEQVQIGG